MQFFVFILVYPFLWGISKLPFRVFYAFSDVIYFIVYHLVGYRKKVVRENLKLIFPKKQEAEIDLIEKKFYSHMCDMFLEMIKTMSLSKEDVKKRYNVVNIEVLQQVLQKKSTLILCSHYANWEWNVSINNYVDTQGYAVYQKVGNKYFDAFIKKVRARWNTILISQKETVRTVVKNYQEAVFTAYGMVSDQSPQWHRAQYWTEFMGVKVPIFNGAESMARKMDLAVVFLKVSKVKRGFYKAEFIPITMEGSKTKPNEITNQFLKLTEIQINEAPEFYLWTHKRWKHRDKVPQSLR